MRPDDFQKFWELSNETIEKFRIYEAQLRKWQRSINLISPNTVDFIWHRHFNDSLQLKYFIKSGSVIADLGSGAGFPGLCLAIACPDIKVTLIESDQRKCEFLRHVSHETGTANVTVENDRVEKIISRLKPDIITARAFAPLEKILDLCRPAFEIRPDIKLLLLKGERARDEIKQAQKAWMFDVEKRPAGNVDQGQVLLIQNAAPK